MVERQRNGITGENLIRGIHFSQTRSGLGPVVERGEVGTEKETL